MGRAVSYELRDASFELRALNFEAGGGEVVGYLFIHQLSGSQQVNILLIYSPTELKSAGESLEVELATFRHLLNKVAGCSLIHQLN